MKYIYWMDLMELRSPEEQTLVENKDLRIVYAQKSIGDLIQKAYHFGIDFNPSYQRGEEWEAEDKNLLIESIFKNVDIGKMTFVVLDEREAKERDYKYSYEILDGKQRLRAILDFLEGRFSYRGKTFFELSHADRIHFKRYPINMAELDNLTEEQKLRFFLTLNTTGKTISIEHLNKVREQLEQVKKIKETIYEFK